MSDVVRQWVIAAKYRDNGYVRDESGRRWKSGPVVHMSRERSTRDTKIK